VLTYNLEPTIIYAVLRFIDGLIMAKYLLRQKARMLRRKGISVKRIAFSLGVSKGTASIWVRDIILSVEQLESLRKLSIAGAERGRLKSAFLQKERWNKKREEARKDGVKAIGNLTDRELLIAGIALYWAEGCRKTRVVEFCNSDPTMVQFLLLWLKKCFLVNLEDVRCTVGINEIHKEREQKVKDYWADISGIPLTQFMKTSFKKAQNKKVYENFNDHYGTLSVHIVQPSRFYVKILGLIDGLASANKIYSLPT